MPAMVRPSLFRAARAPDIPAAVALLCTVATAVLALTMGSGIAGGADSYGYLSQADLWARGSLRVSQPLVHQVPWPSADWTLSPLGYRPAFDRNGDIVPIYAPGYPLVMALVRIAGGPRAMFLVVPLLGALGVWCTYLLGRRVANPLTGALAAVWLASSAAFVNSLLVPMSDVPATTWWLLAVLALTSLRPVAALAAGVAVSAAILTRPNLAPLAIVLVAPLAWPVLRERRLTGPAARRAALFAAGAIPGCVAIGLLFHSLYGSPLQSGYGPVGAMYSWAHARSNVPHYTRWLIEAATPLVALALVAPWVVSRRHAWLALGFFAVLLATYVFYLEFDAWHYVRFLLPACPLLIVSSAAVVSKALDRLRPGRRTLAAAVIGAGLVAWGVTLAANRQVFTTPDGELRYPRVAGFVATRLPERTVVITVQHSGSLRYYANRTTVRYDVLDPRWLARAIDFLREQGRSPYILLEDWEEPGFRELFADHSDLGRLDWPPAAEYVTVAGTHVRLYAPGDRARFLRGEPVVTERIQ
jgi:hypothetical protein